MKSARRFRCCDNYDRRWAANEASISELDGSRESRRLSVLLLSAMQLPAVEYGGNGKIALTTIEIVSTSMVR
jgi:hypothetical protein